MGNRNVEAAELRSGLQLLFTTMRDGGLFGADSIPWFNGGLFLKIDVPPISAPDVAALRTAAGLDWSAIDPSIIGTLFERGLDPKKRSQLGAHYTDPTTIMRLVEPVVIRPLMAEWQEVKETVAKHLARHKRVGEAEHRKARAAFVGFLEKLRKFRVLDPACGSGNFLYLALKSLKDIEHQANIEAETLGLQREVDAYTSPANVLGIEINEYAAELARVTVWIGELQWRLQHGYPFKVNPILDPLDQIECRDALLNADGTEATWPRTNAVIGNPPFVGDKKMRSELGDVYTEALRAAFAGRVPGGADLVCYWFEKARAQIEVYGLGAAGLVATNSIRGGKNRQVLDAICRSARIFEAWSDEPWVNDGAAVRVSLIAFGQGTKPRLSGRDVTAIHADLSAADGDSAQLDLTQAMRLAENGKTCFIGGMKKGQFDVPGDLARRWLREPNPHGVSNSEVVLPWVNGIDMTRRRSDTWIVDFGVDLAADSASLFALPYAHMLSRVKPTRDEVRNDLERSRWWLHARPAPDLRAAVAPLARFLGTPRVAKHRLFVWLAAPLVVDGQIVVTARADDATMGLLHGRCHELWSLRLGTSLEDRPRYTPTSCFETFPFPFGLSPADTAHQRTVTLPDGAIIPANLPGSVRPHAEAIARAAKRLNELRERWLNPPEWTAANPKSFPLEWIAHPTPIASCRSRATKRIWHSGPTPSSTTSAPPGSRKLTKRGRSSGCGLRLGRLHAANVR